MFCSFLNLSSPTPSRKIAYKMGIKKGSLFPFYWVLKKRHYVFWSVIIFVLKMYVFFYDLSCRKHFLQLRRKMLIGWAISEVHMRRGRNPDAREFNLLWRGWWRSPVHQQHRWRAVITELSGDPVVPCLDLSFLVNYKNRESHSHYWSLLLQVYMFKV